MKKYTIGSSILWLVIISVCFSATSALGSEPVGKQNSWSDSVITILKIFGSVGGFLGAAALIWRIIDETKRFLYVDLELCVNSGFVMAKTMVENKGTFGKKIEKAIILVGPEAENPIDTTRKLLPNQKIQFTNDIRGIDLDESIYGEGGRAIIPVDFYHSENLRISDERLGYEIPMKIENLTKGTPYAVRFFIFAKSRLHRSTEKTFVLPETA